MKRVVILLIAIVLASCAHVNKPQTEPAQIVQVEIAFMGFSTITATTGHASLGYIPTISRRVSCLATILPSVFRRNVRKVR